MSAGRSTSGWFHETPSTPGETIRVHLGASPARDNTDAPDLAMPQAFRIARPADLGQLRVHWHPVAQFQYFVAGAARMVRHDVERGCVHYADAFTPYGPLDVTGDEVAFLTLRPVGDTGAFFMPESQPELRAHRIEQDTAIPRRNLSYDLRDASAGVLVSDDDGFAIEVRDLAPHTSTAIDPGVAGSYVVVVDGALVDGDRAVDVDACCHVHASTVVRAGPRGARIGVLRFPSTPTTAAA